MTSPYSERPDTAFWRRAVANLPAEAVDPVGDLPFRIEKADRVVAAGSCFAQHIAAKLRADGYDFLETESGPREENYGVFSTRSGNIYTARQLRQLFQRAYGLFAPAETAWRRADGRFVDPFRPDIVPDGFLTREALNADRERHLGAVREMFEEANVLVFTLGLTECWAAEADGAVVPVAPGVVHAQDHAPYAFQNLSAHEVVSELAATIRDLRVVNPALKIILTVSPVSMIATYTAKHVLQANTVSKAILRVAADEILRTHENIAYFPGYEMVIGPHARGRYYNEDVRTVTPEGVAHVMRLFGEHFLSGAPPTPAALPPSQKSTAAPGHAIAAEAAALEKVVCEEELIDP